MKKTDTTFLITSLVCLLPIALGFYFYDQLPAEIIVHWDAAGEPDGYAPKLLAILGLPIFLFLINAFVHFGIKTDPKLQGQSSRMVTLTKWMVPIIGLVVLPMSLFASMGVEIPIVPILLSMIGLLFILIGNYLPKTRQSYTVGVRLPWTLDSEENWRRTHRLSGYLWIIGGAVMIVSAFIPALWVWVFVLVLVIIVGVPFGYSYYLYRKGV